VLIQVTVCHVVWSHSNMRGDLVWQPCTSCKYPGPFGYSHKYVKERIDNNWAVASCGARRLRVEVVQIRSWLSENVKNTIIIECGCWPLWLQYTGDRTFAKVFDLKVMCRIDADHTATCIKEHELKLIGLRGSTDHCTAAHTWSIFM
jgi:hypothetical protein